jgi:hypothetical protein
MKAEKMEKECDSPSRHLLKSTVQNRSGHIQTGNLNTNGTRIVEFAYFEHRFCFHTNLK